MKTSQEIYDQKILDSNKLIAKFMGVEIVKRNDEDAIFCFENAAYPEYFRCTKHNEYYTDWNMLMPVIEKIDKMNFDVEMGFNCTTIKDKLFDKRTEKPFTGAGVSRMYATYWAVVDFVKWHSTTPSV